MQGGLNCVSNVGELIGPRVRAGNQELADIKDINTSSYQLDRFPFPAQGVFTIVIFFAERAGAFSSPRSVQESSISTPSASTFPF